MWLRSCGNICHVEKILHMTDFSTFLHKTTFCSTFVMWRTFSMYIFSSHFSCGESSPHENLSYGIISPHDRFFLHKHRLWCWWQISGMRSSWMKILKELLQYKEIPELSAKTKEGRAKRGRAELAKIGPTKTTPINWKNSFSLFLTHQLKKYDFLLLKIKRILI